MADDDIQVVWVQGGSGIPRGFHLACAQWLGLEQNAETRPPYHTEICRGCGRFLMMPAAEHNGPKPSIDPRDLLG